MARFGNKSYLLLYQAVQPSPPWWESVSKILAIPVVIVSLIYGWLQIKKIRLDTQKSELDLRTYQPSVRVRYLVCKNDEIIREIANSDFHQLPVGGCMLRETPVGVFLAKLVAGHENRVDGSEVAHEYSSLNEYRRLHPDALVRGEARLENFPYFEAARVPSRDELASLTDSLVQALLAADAPIEEIARALLSKGGCGTDGWQEMIRVRSLWAIYLELTNDSSRSIVLGALEFIADQPHHIGYRTIADSKEGKSHTKVLSGAPMQPGETVVIPIAALLPPLDGIAFEERWLENTDLPSGQWQAFSRANFEPAAARFSIIGPAMWPRSLTVTGDAGSVQLPVRDFLLDNALVLDRGWHIGCCPHLFWETSRLGSISYQGELFNRSPGSSEDYRFVVPAGFDTLVIAELEDEVTTVELVEINGRPVASDETLLKGMELKHTVEAGDLVLIRGFYDCLPPTRPQPWQKNQIIAAYLGRSPSLH